MRQLRVRLRPVAFPLNVSGGPTMTPPPFSAVDQEDRPGGGTWADVVAMLREREQVRSDARARTILQYITDIYK